MTSPFSPDPQQARVLAHRAGAHAGLRRTGNREDRGPPRAVRAAPGGRRRPRAGRVRRRFAARARRGARGAARAVPGIAARAPRGDDPRRGASRPERAFPSVGLPGAARPAARRRPVRAGPGAAERAGPGAVAGVRTHAGHARVRGRGPPVPLAGAGGAPHARRHPRARGEGRAGWVEGARAVLPGVPGRDRRAERRRLRGAAAARGAGGDGRRAAAGPPARRRLPGLHARR